MPQPDKQPLLSQNVVSSATRPAFLSRLWVSLLLFGLFLEWLSPVHKLGGSDALELLVVFGGLTAVLLFAGCFALPGWMLVTVPLLSIGVIMMHLYGGSGVWAWLNSIGPRFAADAEVLRHTGNLAGISGESRFLILLLGWTLLVLSVQMLALSRYTVLLFLGITTVYLFAFEVTVPMDMFWPIVCAFGYGLLLQLTVYTFRRGIVEQGGIASPSGREGARMYHLRLAAGPSEELRTIKDGGSSFVISEFDSIGGSVSDLLPAKPAFPKLPIYLSACIVLAAVAASAFTAFVLPLKPAEPAVWAQAVRSLEAWTETNMAGHTEAESSLSGYDGSDEVLGAPLKLRKDVFFTAVSPVQTYWRGSSLSYYDGRGWSDPDADGILPENGEAGEAAAPSGNANKQQIIQNVKFAEPQTGTVPVFSGGSFIRLSQIDPGVQGDKSLNGYKLFSDPVSGASYIKSSDGMQAVYGYQVITALNETAEEPQEQGTRADEKAADPSEIRYRYLQLPASLPDSVRQLGKQIIADPADRLKAADAVEAYLKSHYTYSLDTSVPPAGQDFVENFLFRQKVGYCDHFSTAMVVLLRSEGIPARWVKGYAPGEQTADNAYTVRYSDAHAWVEVYAPGKGWVSFDPTPAYNGAADTGVSVQQEAAAGLQPAWLDWNWADMKKDLSLLVSVTRTIFANIKPSEVWLTGGGFTAVVLLLVMAVYAGIKPGRSTVAGRMSKKAREGMPDKPAVNESHGFPARAELLKSADKAWAGLYRHYGAKSAGMTAREYAEALVRQAGFEKEEFAGFLHDWEALYYGGSVPDRRATQKFLQTCRKLAARR